MKKWNSQQDCWEGSLSGRPSSHFPQSASLTLSLAQLPTHVQGLCPGFGDVARRGGQGLWPITAYFWVIELVELVRDHCSVCKPKVTKMETSRYFSKFWLPGVKKKLTVSQNVSPDSPRVVTPGSCAVASFKNRRETWNSTPCSPFCGAK